MKTYTRNFILKYRHTTISIEVNHFRGELGLALLGELTDLGMIEWDSFVYQQLLTSKNPLRDILVLLNRRGWIVEMS